ncbi:MAG: AbrB/MazE/SpoVT family DNA-binding domain-containing protein [Thermoplasmatota archaeon]
MEHVTETTPLDEKGRVAIPKAIRDGLGLQPGERLAVTTHAGEIRLKPIARRPRKVRANVRWGRNAFFHAGEGLFGGEE